MIYTLEQLEERYNNLPEAVKEAMYSVETADKITTIGKKYGLHIDQVGETAEETGLVMLGITPYYQFTDSLEKRLGVSRTVTENIASDVNLEIFLPIREFLKSGAATSATPNREETDTIFEQKMAKMFNLPKEQAAPQLEQPVEKKIDPYLEPAK